MGAGPARARDEAAGQAQRADESERRADGARDRARLGRHLRVRPVP